MTISVACPHCGRPYLVPSEFAGRRFRCRACGDEVPIPEMSPAELDVQTESGLVSAPLPGESDQTEAPAFLQSPGPFPSKSQTQRAQERMPSTIVLALVFGAIHMVEDLFFILSGFSVAGDAPQTAGPIILAGLIRLGIELSLFTGLSRRSSVARLAWITLTSLGLGVQVLVLLTMSWVALSGQQLPDIAPDELRMLASTMACCGGIGILLRLGGIASLLPESAARWCDVSSSPPRSRPPR